MQVLKQWMIWCFVVFAWNVSAQQVSPCKEYLDKALSLYFSDPDSSDTFTTLALECAEHNNSQGDKALALAYRGKYLLLKADLEEAQKSLNAAHQIALELNDVKCIAYVLKLKSILQDRIGNAEESTVLLEESLAMYEKAGDRKGVNSARVNLSLDYIETNKFDKAEAMLELIRVSLNEDSANAYFYYQNLGKLRLAQKRTKEAIEFLHKATSTAQRRKMIDSEATVLMILGEAYLSVKDFAHADTCLRRSEQIAISNKLDHELDETYAVFIQLYSEQGKYREAFETLTKKTALRDKMLNIEKINSIAALEKKLALSEKEKQLVKEKHKSQQAKAQTERLYYV
ncbi:MAG: hypothetical protein Fur0041_02970 [Bacteroidia bacterium]